MDRGTWIGFLLGVALLAVAIGLGPNPRIFLHGPALIVVMGLTVGGILISLLLPIFTMIQGFKG